MDRAAINRCTGQVIDAAFAVHSTLGPGLLERVYAVCLAYELRQRGHRVREEVAVPVVYKGVRLEVGYRIDLLVDDAVVVEVKALSTLLPVHKAQLLSHIRLSRHRVGLLLNFHTPHLKDGISRVVNRL